MKNFSIMFSAIIFALNCAAQINTRDKYPIDPPVAVINTNDTTLRVFHIDETSSRKRPLYFLQEQVVGEFLFNTINPQYIADVKVIKGEIELAGIKYSGQVHIKMKGGYEPRLISITDLKKKYVKTNHKQTIFTIDGSIINSDYDKFLVDENNLLRIIVEKVKNEKENIDLNLVKLLTKSEENIQKSTQIRIRGLSSTSSTIEVP